MSDKNQVTIGCGGCLGLIAFGIVLWGLLFGVTWNGTHHGITCTCDHGVVVQ